MKNKVRICLGAILIIALILAMYFSLNISIITDKSELIKLLTFNFSDVEMVAIDTGKPERYGFAFYTSIGVIAKGEEIYFSEDSISYVKTSFEQDSEEEKIAREEYSFFEQELFDTELPDFEEITSSGSLFNSASIYEPFSVVHTSYDINWFKFEKSGESYVCFYSDIPRIIINLF